MVAAVEVFGYFLGGAYGGEGLEDFVGYEVAHFYPLALFGELVEVVLEGAPAVVL